MLRPGRDHGSGERVIGGVVSWELSQASPAGSAAAMSGGVAGSPTGPVRGPITLFENVIEGEAAPPGPIWVAADLDLTNRDELQTLAESGPEPRGLLAALYAKEGVGFVRRLRGAFALALWDERSRELTLAVDHFGIKRLYYATGCRGLAFAAQASVLPALAGIERRVDATTVYNYLNFGFVPAPRSAFQGVSRLAPGHLLRFREGHTVLDRYWDMRYPERPVRRAESAATVYRLTEEAVRRTFVEVSAKEAGAFLSGGTDSSTVVGLMGRLTGERVNAFSIGFWEGRYNELDYAELAARHFEAAHHTRIVTPEMALELLPRLVDAYDEPFGNNSAIGTFFCAQLARDCRVSLLLAGDGGDEIFGGNDRYRTDRVFGVYHCVPAALRQRLLEPILLSLPDGGATVLGRAQRYIQRANLPNPRRFYSYEFFFAGEGADLLTPDFRAAVDADAPYAVAESHYERVQATSELNRLLYLDLKLAIGDNDLLKVTRTAELAGVNVRFPLLDLLLVEYTATLPAPFKVRGLEKRHLFKRAFRDLLPRAVLVKQKHGFGVPTSAWLRGHREFRALARDTLLSPRARVRGYFRAGALDRLFAWHETESTPYYGDLLWRILMLELWHRRHVDEAIST